MKKLHWFKGEANSGGQIHSIPMLIIMHNFASTKLTLKSTLNKRKNIYKKIKETKKETKKNNKFNDCIDQV